MLIKHHIHLKTIIMYCISFKKTHNNCNLKLDPKFTSKGLLMVKVVLETISAGQHLKKNG